MRGTQLLFAAGIVIGACSGIQFLKLSAQNPLTTDPGEYEYVAETSRWVMLVQGETESIGKLDATGNFTPDKRWFQFRKGQSLSSVPPNRVINEPAQKGIFEFRSGRLIPGDLDKDGNFVPTVGRRVVDFKEYRYGPKALNIYNLPGRFVKKEKKD